MTYVENFLVDGIDNLGVGAQVVLCLNRIEERRYYGLANDGPNSDFKVVHGTVVAFVESGLSRSHSGHPREDFLAVLRAAKGGK